MSESKESFLSSRQTSQGGSLGISKYQTFHCQELNRSQIKGADYNPRTLSTDAEKRLRRSLKTNGLVEPLIWNEQTGNLVGGHQRLKILDQLHKDQNYSITVAVINVDIKQEKKLNIALNNQTLQGEYDASSLSKLIEEIGLDEIDDTGFNLAEIKTWMPSDSQVLQSIDEVEKQSNKAVAMDVAEMRRINEKTRSNNNGKHAQGDDDASFYVTLVFRSSNEVEKFLIDNCFDPNMSYIDGNEISNRLKGG